MKAFIKILAMLLCISMISGCAAVGAALGNLAGKAMNGEGELGEIVIPEEEIVISDGPSLAKATLKEFAKGGNNYILFPWVRANGNDHSQGTDRYFYFSATRNIENMETYYHENNNYSMGGEKNLYISDYYGYKGGTSYYRGAGLENYVYGTGFTPEIPADVPGTEFLTAVAEGIISVTYEAFEDGSYKLETVLFGSDLENFVKEYFPGLLDSSVVNPDFWSTLSAEIEMEFHSYQTVPSEITVDCPEVITYLVENMFGYENYTVEEGEITSNFYYYLGTAPEGFTSAVPGEIPYRTTFADAVYGNTDSADGNENAGGSQTELAPEELPRFERLETTDDITLSYKGTEVLMTYPWEMKLFEGSNFDQQDYNNVIIVNNLIDFGANGRSQVVLQNSYGIDNWFQEEIDFYKNYALEEGYGFFESSEFTITVNGLTYNCIHIGYTGTNLFGTKIVSNDYLAYAKVADDVYVKIEMGLTYDEKKASSMPGPEILETFAAYISVK